MKKILIPILALIITFILTKLTLYYFSNYICYSSANNFSETLKFIKYFISIVIFLVTLVILYNIRSFNNLKEFLKSISHLSEFEQEYIKYSTKYKIRKKTLTTYNNAGVSTIDEYFKLYNWTSHPDSWHPDSSTSDRLQWIINKKR